MPGESNKTPRHGKRLSSNSLENRTASEWSNSPIMPCLHKKEKKYDGGAASAGRTRAREEETESCQTGLRRPGENLTSAEPTAG